MPYPSLATCREHRAAWVGSKEMIGSARILDSICELAPSGDLIVLSPHPDDEVLGCGGALALAHRLGLRLIVVALTDGAASHPNSKVCPPMHLAALRAREQREGLDIIAPGTPIQEAFFQDGTLGENIDEAVERIKAGLPLGATLFSTDPEDLHPDHRAGYQIGVRLAHHLAGPHYSMPIRSHVGAHYGAAGDLALDVGPALDLKRRALNAHTSQISDLIYDDPTGFRLNEADLAFHFSGWEVFRPQSV